MIRLICDTAWVAGGTSVSSSAKILPHTGICELPCATTRVRPSMISFTLSYGKVPPFRLAIWVRSAGRGCNALAAGPDVAASLGVASCDPARCGVLINATPLGLSPNDPAPIPPEVASAAEVALDLVYAPGETRWVQLLRGRGLRAADGRTMLVAQGAAAFERWFPGTKAPREIMRATVDAALR